MAAHKGKLAYMENRYPDFGCGFKGQITRNALQKNSGKNEIA